MNFTATVKNGKLEPSHPVSYLIALQEFEGKDVDVTVSKAGKQRTTPQNAYYFGVVVKMIHSRLLELGFTRGDLTASGSYENLTADDVHGYLRETFNRVTLFNKRGQSLGSFGGSTKELNTDAFAIYVDRIRVWASDNLDINIPDPSISVGYEYK